ncbi:MAG TPA: hypothetical protein VM840_08760 [Actinomycetota bacterium]|nr:hypothetical protein [Actinomycetota bacterium]
MNDQILGQLLRTSGLGATVCVTAGAVAGWTIRHSGVLTELARERRQAKQALKRAQVLAEDVRRQMGALREALVQLQTDAAGAEPSAPTGVEALWPPPASHQLKEEAEALRLCADIVAARLDDAGRVFSLAS